MIQIFSAGRDGRTGPTKGSTRGPRGPKNKSNANMESPITILWNVSKPRPDDREALRAGSAHTKPENGHRCMFVNARTNKNKYNHSSKYRNTTGNARLRNVGKCHPGDKKEGVPHLLEN